MNFRLIVSVCLLSVVLARVQRTAQAGDFDFERLVVFDLIDMCFGSYSKMCDFCLQFWR